MTFRISGGQFTELTLRGLLALPVAGIASRILYWSIPAVTEVVRYLCFRRLLDQQLGESLEQLILANQVFRLSLVGQ